MRFDFEAEAYSRTGNIAADGIQRLLGNPDMSRLETVLRESVQNSWDARLDGSIPEYRVALRQLSGEKVAVLAHEIFAGLNLQPGPLGDLDRCLKSDSIRILQIADFNTSGLGGPTNPSAVPRDGESTNFVDFLRNIGTPRDSIMGGGTYGYGKSSLYVASQCRTIIVDSVTEYRGKPERRMMACNIGHMYHIPEGMTRGGRYTGRHWWGLRDEDGALHPVRNEVAEGVANRIGLPERSSSDRGTTIAIMEPVLGDEDDFVSDEIGPAIVGMLLSNFWPKMVERADGTPPMRFSLHVLGDDIAIPHPEQAPPLGPYVQALRLARSKKGEAIQSQRPRKRLGTLSVKPGPRLPRLQDVRWPRTASFAELSHHVALMRPAELVIRYLPGNALSRDSVEWGGTFIVDDEDHEVEHAFALSEPPAHDDWIPSSMEKGLQKTMVNVGLREIKRRINSFGVPSVRPGDRGSDISLAGIADTLGTSLLGGPGQRLGAEAPAGRGGGSGGAPRTPRGRLNVTFAGLERTEGGPCSRYTVSCGATPGGYRMRGVPEVLLDDRKTVQVAPNGRRPEIIGWYDESGKVVSARDTLQVPPEGGEYSLLVSRPDVVAVRLRVFRDREFADEL